MILAARKQSLGRVMFLYLSVGRSVRRGVPACTTGHMTMSLSRGVSVREGGLCPGGSLSRGTSVWEVSVREVSVRETPHTVTSGRYASYWNAFL